MPIIEIARKPTIVFCLPGNNFSGDWLVCWTKLIAYCMQNQINFVVNNKSSCNIYYVRNMCLGADVSRGENQKPFDGKIEYDYLMWIDSDIIFTPEQFQNLLNHKKDIVSGLYLMENGTQYATVKEWDEEYFKMHSSFKFFNKADIEGKKSLIDVAYTGFGFILIKKGVFETMKYPWFKQLEFRIGNAVDMCMEDVTFCMRAKENKFDILVDPTVIVGHEKKRIL